MSNDFRTPLMDFHDHPNDPFYISQVKHFEEVRHLLKTAGKPPEDKSMFELWRSYIDLLRQWSSFCKPYFLDFQEYCRKL